MAMGQKGLRSGHTIEPAGVTSNIQVECSRYCSLPFFLQDLCLLVVINELDHYPTERLASLPQWMCYRILSSAPALDLARLESTPVANGIDTDKIWKLLKATDKYGYEFRLKRKAENPFPLNTSKDHHHAVRLFCRRNAAIEEIVKDLSDVNHSE